MDYNNEVEAALALTNILGCFLHQVDRQEGCFPDCDPEQLRIMAEKHSLSAITAAALETAGVLDTLFSEEKVQAWSDIKWNAIRKTMLVGQETEKLLRYMEEHAIWNLPLKGHIISGFYPEAWMREMADRDILIDPAFRKHMKKHMMEEGYTVEKYRMYVDDVYLKEPVYNFELHWGLFDEGRFSKYYENVYERLMPEEGSRYRMRFTDEDAYVYIMAHAYKHYCKGGNGLRSLLDTYIWNQAKPDMNKSYIARELKALGISGFTDHMEKLANKLFSGAVITETALESEEREMLGYIAGSGTYGTLANLFSDRIEQTLDNSRSPMEMKRKYVLSRIFPDKKLLYPYFRYAEDHNWAIPIAWFKRLFIFLKEKRGRFKAEWRIVNSYKMEEGSKDDRL